MFKDIEKVELYSHNNKLVGIPVFIYYSVMYHNIELLNKYNKTIPKTWNELLETGKYILQQEKKNNNNIMIYNGEFAYDEIGMSSLYEYIYSFRDNINDPFPDLRSQNALDAIKMLKRIKKEISSDEYFQNLLYSIQCLIDGNALFIKQNHINIPVNKVYKTTILPGRKVGISGSFIGGDNIGINKYIDKKNKKAAIQILMHLTSKVVQKKMMIKFNIFSGITSLYEEKEICNLRDLCEIYKVVQPISKPVAKTNDYYEYSEKFRYYIFNYLYGDDDVDPEEMLRKIDDMTRVYYIAIESKEGKIIFMTCMTIALFIFLSSLFLFIKEFQYQFNFLSKEIWVLSLTGYILLLFIISIDIDKVTPFRCHLKLCLQFIGFTLIFVPIFHKLISNFPEENRVSFFVNDHPYLFILAFLAFDIVILLLILINPYKIKDIIVTDGKNFQKCKMGGILSLLVLMLSVFVKIGIFLLSLFLIFLEWNLKSIFYDIRFCISAYLVDSILIVLISLMDYFDNKHYNSYTLIREILTLLFIITNYFLLYANRVFWYKLFKYNGEDYLAERIPHQSTVDSTSSYLRRFSFDSDMSYTLSNHQESNNNSSYRYFINILRYHYRNEIISSRYRKSNMYMANIHNNGIQSMRSYRSRRPLSRYNNTNIPSSRSYIDMKSLSKNYQNGIQFQNTLINSEVSSTNDSLINESISMESSNNIISQLRENSILNNNTTTSSSNTSSYASSSNTTLNNNSSSYYSSSDDINASSHHNIPSIDDLTLMVQNQKDITDNLIKKFVVYIF